MGFMASHTDKWEPAITTQKFMGTPPGILLSKWDFLSTLGCSIILVGVLPFGAGDKVGILDGTGGIPPPIFTWAVCAGIDAMMKVHY